MTDPKSPDAIDTVIFDLDGTLIDTEPSATRAVENCFSEWKIQIERKDSTYVTGRTWESAFEYLFNKYPIPISKTEAKSQVMTRYHSLLEHDLYVVPGSVQAVQSLAPYFSLGLVSGSTRAEILWALDQLKIREHFKVILGAEDYPRSKPFPDGYLKAMSDLEVRPTRCLIFEDSTAGLASARASGAWVVAITSTNHFEQDHSKAHLKINDLTLVNSQWIKNLNLNRISSHERNNL